VPAAADRPLEEDRRVAGRLDAAIARLTAVLGP